MRYRNRWLNSVFYFDLCAHPWMNAALEFDGLPRWENCTAGSWTVFFFSRLHEDIRRAVRSWLKHRSWNEHCA
jgi:hypothetical protein